MKVLSSYITISVVNTKIKNILLAFLGSIVIAISAQITIPLPFTLVPITGQTFAVLSIGMVLGARYGALSLIMYLGEGIIGIPVFAGFKSGIATILGPTGGYLIGFVLAAYIVGLLSEKGWDRSFIKTCVAMLIGNIVIYIPGLIQLGIILGWDKPIFALGFTPFIIGDIIKMLFAALLFPLVWSKIKK